MKDKLIGETIVIVAKHDFQEPEKSVFLVPWQAEDQENPLQRNELKKRRMTFSSSQMFQLDQTFLKETHK